MLDWIRTHIYQERDSGVMLIGSRSALVKLMVELTETLRDAPEADGLFPDGSRIVTFGACVEKSLVRAGAGLAQHDQLVDL